MNKSSEGDNEKYRTFASAGTRKEETTKKKAEEKKKNQSILQERKTREKNQSNLTFTFNSMIMWTIM